MTTRKKTKAKTQAAGRGRPQGFAGRIQALKEEIAEARKTQRMTPDEYKAAIEKLGLTQTTAGIFLDASRRTSQRWASGEMEIPLPIKIALTLMIKHGKEPKDFDKYFDMEA